MQEAEQAAEQVVEPAAEPRATRARGAAQRGRQPSGSRPPVQERWSLFPPTNWVPGGSRKFTYFKHLCHGSITGSNDRNPIIHKITKVRFQTNKLHMKFVRMTLKNLTSNKKVNIKKDEVDKHLHEASEES